MKLFDRLFDRIEARVRAIDRLLLSLPVPVRAVVIALTIGSMAATVLPKIPQYGTDTVADTYESRVVLNDVRDMYTKQKVEQTPIEAETWTKAASAPYPPVTLLVLAGLYAVGQTIGVGLYGMVSFLAVVFLGASLVYFWRTRWYLFPLLYLNFSYFGERLFYVQDGSYLVMLTVVMAAVAMSRRAPSVTHMLMAVAITMKLSPLYYLRHLPSMPRRVAATVVAIVLAGLVLPYFIWENYLYIFQYHNELKGSAYGTAGAVLIGGAVTALLWRAESRGRWDLDDLVGWSLVPVALFFAFKMNVARHLLIVLLVPDKRGLRNAAAGIGMLAHYAAPALVPVNSALPIAAGILVMGLWARGRSTRRSIIPSGPS